MRLLVVALLLPLTACVERSAVEPAQAPADLILERGKFVTMDDRRPGATMVAIRDGLFVAVGSDEEATRFVGPNTRVIDLHGQLALPGFHDSHVHLHSGGLSLTRVNLSGIMEREAVFQKLREWVAAHPGDPWLIGRGWELPVFEAANPHRRWLDAIVADRPAAMRGADGHSLWVNTKALDLAGVTAKTPDPPGGRIERDPDGSPSGTLRESAQELVSRLFPPLTMEQRREALRLAVRLANSFGITSAQDASVDADEVRSFMDADRDGELSLHVVAALEIDSPDSLPNREAATLEQVQGAVEPSIERAKLLRESNRSPHLAATSVKLFADGVVEARTAALLEPYQTPLPDGTFATTRERGMLLWRPNEMNWVVDRLERERFDIHVHAIGDAAIRTTLDAFETARRVRDGAPFRHTIAHLELIDPLDWRRFKQLGVVANFQPLWAFRDPYMRELNEPQLGPERSRYIYPIAALQKAGASLACGSDWPVTSLNPLLAIEVAIARTDPALTETTPAWLPEYALDLPSALTCYTLAGAYLNRTEERTGAIVVGRSADLAVLGRDLFSIPAAQIGETPVTMTVFEGKIVYERAASGGSLAASRGER